MKRKLMTAAMATMVMVSSAVPAFAMIGVEKPEDPDMMVITSMPNQVVKKMNKAVLPVAEPTGEAVPVPYIMPIKVDESVEPLPEVQDSDLAAISYLVETGIRHESQAYEVKEGDTVWNIAQKQMKLNNPKQIASAVQKIADLNQLDNPNVIYTGAKLTLPTN